MGLHGHADALSWQPSAFWDNEFPSYRRLSYKEKFHLIINNSKIVCFCLSLYILTYIINQIDSMIERLNTASFPHQSLLPLFYLSIVTSTAFWYSRSRDELCLLSDFLLTIIIWWPAWPPDPTGEGGNIDRGWSCGSLPFNRLCHIDQISSLSS